MIEGHRSGRDLSLLHAPSRNVYVHPENRLNCSTSPSFLLIEAMIKTKRVSIACDLCRSKKMKCDGRSPECTRCENHGLTCHYTEIHRKPTVRKPRRKPVPRNGLVGLDQRMAKLEAVVSSLVKKLNPQLAPQQAENDAQSDATSPYSSSGPSSPQQPDTPTAAAAESNSHYFGKDHSFSVMSRRGIRWLSKLAGDPELPSRFDRFQRRTSTAFVLTNSRWTEPVEKSQIRGLPPRQVVLPLIEKVFDELVFAAMFLCRSEAICLFDSYYAAMQNPQNIAGKRLSNSDFLSMNVLICIGALFMSESEGQDDVDVLKLQQLQQISMKNATHYFHKTSVVSDGIRTIQALMLMVIYSELVKEFPHPFMIVSTMVRLAQDMGLHRKEALASLAPDQAMLRRRLWLCVYLFDHDCCSKTGKPPIINQNDVSSVGAGNLKTVLFYGCCPDDVEKMMDPHYDLRGALSQMTKRDYLMGPQKMLVFYHHCNLVHFNSVIYSELYGANSLDDMSIEQVMNKIESINYRLDRLSKSLPMPLQPGANLDGIHEPVMLCDLSFAHLQYYSCVVLVNKLAFTKSWVNEDEPRPISGLQLSLMNKCLSAARVIMKRVQVEDHFNSRFSNIAMFHFFCAFFTVIAGVVELPTASFVKTDLALLMDAKKNILRRHTLHCTLTGDSFLFNITNYCILFFSRAALLVYSRANNDDVDVSQLDQEIIHFDSLLTEQISQKESFARSSDPLATLLQNSMPKSNSETDAISSVHDILGKSTGGVQLNRSLYYPPQRQQVQDTANNMNSSPLVPNLSSPMFQFNDNELSHQFPPDAADYNFEDNQKESGILQQIFGIPSVFLNQNDRNDRMENSPF